MSLIDFIKQYADRNNEFTQVLLEWIWISDGVDEEFSFDGKPSEFIEKYTRDYHCLDGIDIFNVHRLDVANNGLRSCISIVIVRD